MIKFFKKNILLMVLLLFFSFIFFYKLDYNTLGSWDEGWYASIARNILKSGNFIDLYWNGKPYFDHPPFGFWLMAISYKLFGISEFSTRLPSAIAGLISIVLLYDLTTRLFLNKHLGFISSIILGTSVWYVIRVRSGNLDSILILLFITTLYLALRSSTDFRWFPLVLLSYGALVMTKTLIGVPIILLILMLNFHQFYLKKLMNNLPFFALGSLLFILLVFPWYNFHLKAYPEFFQHHFVNIGLRDKTISSFLNIQLEKPLFYLHMGVRKWYYIWLLGMASIFSSLSFIKKNYLFVLLWNILILYPFVTSDKTELWHLIPVYVPLSIITAAGPYILINPGLKIIKKVFQSNKIHSLTPPGWPNGLPGGVKTVKQLMMGIYLTGFILIALWQVKIFYKEVYPASIYVPDDVAISKAAGKYQKTIYLDDDYIPLAVYYSGKNITPVSSLPDGQKTLHEFFSSNESKLDIIVITRNWVVEDLINRKISFKILEKNNSFSIVTK